jgi:hypothetical protein
MGQALSAANRNILLPALPQECGARTHACRVETFSTPVGAEQG